MDVPDETIWDANVERRGVAWVAYNLRVWPGQPGDGLLGVVYEQQPCRTRDFAKGGAPNKRAACSRCRAITVVAVIAFIVLGEVNR
jgi:hypothetical protein